MLVAAKNCSSLLRIFSNCEMQLAKFLFFGKLLEIASTGFFLETPTSEDIHVITFYNAHV